MLKPRDYQREALDALRSARAEGKKKALLVMASGLGKTLTGAFDIRECLKATPNGRVLVLCHSVSVLSQIKTVYQSVFGEEYSYGMYNGYEKAAHRTDFLFANLQSMNLHGKDFDPEEFFYVVVDEAHHSPAETFRKAIQHFRPQFLLGMTATSQRTDDAELDELFGETVYEYDLIGAINDGWLSEIDYRLELDELGGMAPFLNAEKPVSLAQLNREIFIPKRDEKIIGLIRERSAQKKDPTTVIFCQTIDHAKHIAGLIGDAVLIHSDLDPKVVAERLEDFRNGKIRTVCAVNILNEGIDIPRTDVIVFLRVTQSKVVFFQQLGRGLRLAEGKGKVLVLDFVANAERLDQIFDLEREFKVRQTESVERTPGRQRESFTLNIDTPLFRERRVDIIELIRRAKEKTVAPQRTNEELIRMLAVFGKQIGRVPTIKDLDNDPNMPCYETYRMRFGSLDNALELAGFPRQNQHRRVFTSREEIVEVILKRKRETGKTPTKRELNSDPEMPSDRQIRKYFDSFNNAIIAAGLTPSKTTLKLTREEMLNLLRRKCEFLGRAPTMSEVDADPDMPNSSSYERRFGSFRAAIRLVGFAPNEKHRVLGCKKHREAGSKEEMIKLFRDKAARIGRTPTAVDLDDDPEMPSACTYRRKIGSLTDVAILAGLKPNKPPRKRT